MGYRRFKQKHSSDSKFVQSISNMVLFHRGAEAFREAGAASAAEPAEILIALILIFENDLLRFLPPDSVPGPYCAA
jgi:hypothetical protein